MIMHYTMEEYKLSVHKKYSNLTLKIALKLIANKIEMLKKEEHVKLKNHHLWFMQVLKVF